jgi:hypothetical protein
MAKKSNGNASQAECPTPKGKLLAIGGKENKGKDPEEGSNQENNNNFANMCCFRKELRRAFLL